MHKLCNSHWRTEIISNDHIHCKNISTLDSFSEPIFQSILSWIIHLFNEWKTKQYEMFDSFNKHLKCVQNFYSSPGSLHPSICTSVSYFFFFLTKQSRRARFSFLVDVWRQYRGTVAGWREHERERKKKISERRVANALDLITCMVAPVYFHPHAHRPLVSAERYEPDLVGNYRRVQSVHFRLVRVFVPLQYLSEKKKKNQVGRTIFSYSSRNSRYIRFQQRNQGRERITLEGEHLREKKGVIPPPAERESSSTEKLHYFELPNR